MRWLILASLVACSSPSSPKTAAPASTPAPDPQAFALRLIDVLERDDLAGWKALRAGAERTTDDALHGQLESWRRDLLPKAQALRTATFTLDRSGSQHFVVYTIDGREPETLAVVIEDHGALQIDET